MEGSFRQGIIYSLTAYLLWGILPIYWKTLGSVQAFEILSNRFIWSCVFVWVLIIASGKVKSFLAETQSILSNRQQSLAMLAAAVTISFNWGLFIWAVNDGRIVETSMGYYINPLVSIVFGVFFLKERLDTWQMAAVGCAVIGVGTMLWNLGQLPWVSVSLAMSFALYGLIKKCLAVTTMTSIMLETLLITPLAIAYEYYLSLEGVSAYQTASTGMLIMLACAGIVTATPLLFFTAGAKLLPLKIVGFLQYIAPTISLLIGVFLYKESFTSVHMVAFGWIWFGLFLFTISQVKRQ
ncbi:EamA family transporter RarD [uncultured Phascolarctobacterium sp.]|uniref:EamA family transporter RarD n=1 Tax=uncultured Phascolarctobacterium sp. TaxID=512296 RepID=UPI0027D99D3E|nr:EamA family transporter RarD [uncultured Phascolarctobacterium sp.]